MAEEEFAFQKGEGIRYWIKFIRIRILSPSFAKIIHATPSHQKPERIPILF